jgi:NadR type nicotinamide-nucleotide adenylyltransferase
MLKVVVTGPESSGKTTLTQSLAAHYRVPWVAEYARAYISQLSRPYQEADLLRIAQEQVRREDATAQAKPSLLICDTSLLVLRIWSYYRYGRCHPWIEQQLAQRPVDHYLLCSPDLPWQPDPQRENQHNRLELFKQYEQALSSKPYTLVSGRGSKRLNAASQAIDRLLST